VLELERLRAGEYEDDCPLLTQVMREDDKVEILFLAMLFHDIGKGFGHGHSERGAGLVGDIAARFDLNTDDTRQLQLLVLHHLLMAHLAQRRDIHDDDLILTFAKQVGDVSTLRKLYLLTFADMKAVRPGYWNNWRDMLLGELYVRTLQVLERGMLVEEDRAARVARVKERARRALEQAGHDRGLDAFFHTMPDSYFLMTPELSIPGHVRVADRFRRAALDGRARVETSLRHLPEWDHSEFTVCTEDRPGLFSMLAGVLAAAGLNVVNARISTSTEAMALDEFRVSHEDRRETVLEEDRWERIRRNLEAVVNGEKDVETLVAESHRWSIASKPRRRVRRAPTNVVVDNDVSRDYTVLDVYTEDRIGVLFSVTRGLYRLGLQIHLAKITTSLDQVLDVFYVTDEQGLKIEDTTRLDSIKGELTDRLTRDAAGAQA
jgi:[protein-PII] uridylyltransferase